MAARMAEMSLVLKEEQLNTYAWLMLALAAVCFIFLYFNQIPYGRYAGSFSLGFAINARLAWLVQECPSFFVPLVLLFSNSRQELRILLHSPNVVLLSMFLLHYFRRSFIYPFTVKNAASTPFVIFVIIIAICTLNGYIQGQYLTRVAQYNTEWFYSPHFLIGTSIFFLGFAINVHSDYIITNLRKPGETGHKIPRGGLFEYVSGANYFGEIIEWSGYALACSSFVAFSFFILTVSNIGPRAWHHHRFYKEKFEDYPKRRKAIIPYIF